MKAKIWAAFGAAGVLALLVLAANSAVTYGPAPGLDPFRPLSFQASPVGASLAHLPLVAQLYYCKDRSGEGRAVISAGGGDFIVAGASTDSDDHGHDDGDVWVLRVGSWGDIKWSVSYNSTVSWDFDSARAVARCSGGGFLVAGDEGGTNEDHNHAFAMKLSEDGRVLWMNEYSFEDDFMSSVLASPDGGSLVVGSTYVTAPAPSYRTASQGLIFKLDPEGHVLWRKAFAGEDGVYFYSILSLSNGDLMISGKISLYPGFHSEALLVRLSPEGGLLWARSYAKGSEGEFRTIIPAPGDNTLAVGTIGPGTKSDYAIWALELTENGDIAWQNEYGSDVVVRGQAAIPTGDNGFFILGNDEYKTGGHFLKLNSLGDIEWQMRGLVDQGYHPGPWQAAVQDEDGSTVITGWSGNELLLMRYGSIQNLPQCLMAQDDAESAAVTTAEVRTLDLTERTPNVRRTPLTAQSNLGAVWTKRACGPSMFRKPLDAVRKTTIRVVR